ncbi:MAG: FtsX-like permease family protein [Thermodesulfobacteria bacterium]|nr:FtsX-like permease family protein [Thermodesulfobacteriota bacterium]
MDFSILLRGLFLASVVKALRHGAMKTVFALFAISFGISSIVFIVAAIEGSNLQAKKIIELLGPGSIFVRSGFGGKGTVRRLGNRLDIQDFKALKKVVGVERAAYLVLKRVDMSSLNRHVKAYVVGAMKDFLYVFDYKIAQGRPFRPREYLSVPKVCIIGTELAQELFGNASPLGKSIRINKTSFEVIGVFAKKGKLPSGRSLDNRAILPINTYRKFIEPEYKRFFAIKLKVASDVSYNLIVKQVRQLLLRRHDPHDFVVITPETIRKFLNIFNFTLSIYLGLVSMAALFISGFVMSNIFSINVKVRAWEIGIRRAMGATRSHIILQFLCEAVMISLLGAVFGSILGFLGIRFLMPLLNIPTVYPTASYVAAVVFSIGTGIASALLPAKNAAQWEPVRALRSRL